MLVWSWGPQHRAAAQLPRSALALAAAPVVTALILPAEWPHHGLPASLQLLPWLVTATTTEWPYLHNTLNHMQSKQIHWCSGPKHAKP